jgi:hypothetical protein
MPVIISNGKRIEDWKGGMQAALHRNSERLRKLAIKEWLRQEHEIANNLLQDPLASNDLLQAPSAPAEELSANAEEPTFHLFGEADASLFWTEMFEAANQFGFRQDDTFHFNRFT